MKTTIILAAAITIFASCSDSENPAHKPASFDRKPIVGRLHQWVGDTIAFNAPIQSLTFKAYHRKTYTEGMYREGVYSVKVNAVVTLTDGTQASILAGYINNVPRLRTREWASALDKINKYFSGYVWQAGEKTIVVMFQTHGGPTWAEIK